MKFLYNNSNNLVMVDTTKQVCLNRDQRASGGSLICLQKSAAALLLLWLLVKGSSYGIVKNNFQVLLRQSGTFNVFVRMNFLDQIFCLLLGVQLLVFRRQSVDQFLVSSK